MASLLQRLQKTSTLKHTDILSQSEVFNTKDTVPTPIPALNIAYSADIHGGLSSGIHLWAGPSKHFKTLFCLISAAAYMDKYPDAILIMYDNEFGSGQKYFESVGIDPDRVLHSPFMSLEELRTDLINQLKEIERGEKAVIVIDSLGMAASEKEIKDAEDGSEKADMTRAKVNKSLSRIITPYLRLKDIPLLAVQHTYQEMTMYPKTIVSGGTGMYLAADDIYILGRQQVKEGTGPVSGYNFIINVEKSRHVQEKSKIPITVRFEGGVDKWSGLFDIAVEGGYITRLNQQSYGVTDPNTGEVIRDKLKRKDIENDSKFWNWLITSTDFNEYINSKFAVTTGKLINDDPTEEYLDGEVIVELDNE